MCMCMMLMTGFIASRNHDHGCQHAVVMSMNMIETTMMTTTMIMIMAIFMIMITIMVMIVTMVMIIIPQLNLL